MLSIPLSLYKALTAGGSVVCLSMPLYTIPYKPIKQSIDIVISKAC